MTVSQIPAAVAPDDLYFVVQTTDVAGNANFGVLDSAGAVAASLGYNNATARATLRNELGGFVEVIGNGLFVPIKTQAEVTALGTLPAGLLVYNSTTGRMVIGNGTVTPTIPVAINDATASTTSVYSSSQVVTLLGGKMNTTGGNAITGDQTAINGNWAVIALTPTSTGNGFSVTGALGQQIQFGYNNAANEAYVWNTAATRLKLGTSGLERLGIEADGRVAIGTATPSASAAFQVDSTTRGFLPPRMTTAQKTGIPSPPVGLKVFDTTLDCTSEFTSTGWVNQFVTQAFTLSAVVATTSAALADVAGLSFNAVAGATYLVKFIGLYQSNNTVNGCQIGPGGTATGTVVGNARGGISNITTTNENAVPLISTTSSLFLASVISANAPHHLELNWIFQATGAGTHTIRFAAEVAGSSSQLNAGSTMIVQRLA